MVGKVKECLAQWLEDNIGDVANLVLVCGLKEAQTLVDGRLAALDASLGICAWNDASEHEFDKNVKFLDIFVEQLQLLALRLCNKASQTWRHKTDELGWKTIVLAIGSNEEDGSGTGKHPRVH